MPVGTIEKFEGKYAIVKLERQDMCGDCHACEMVTGKTSCTLKCVNEIKGKIGDRVEVELENETFLKATYIMYGLPFVGFIGGLVAGYILQDYLKISWGEILCVITALLGMGIVFGFIKIKDKKNAYKKYLPYIIAKVE